MEQNEISADDSVFVKTHTNSGRAQMEQLINLESFLRSRIRGQDHVIERICSALQRAELGLCKAGRPKASFMFLGPTGVGKTETTIAFTSYILGAEALAAVASPWSPARTACGWNRRVAWIRPSSG